MIDPGIVNLARSDDSLATLRVDVIADLICPWCYLGKRRLDDALEAVRGPSVVSWYPFQLNPEMPAEGMEFEQYLSSKFGSAEAVQPGLDQLADAGPAHGIHFRFDRIVRVPNTLDAHRLMQLAEQRGRDTSQLAEALLHSFFAEGQDISNREVLEVLGREADLSVRDIRRTLDDETSRQIVLNQEAQVRKGGVTGVPDFLVNKRLFVTGAQSTDILVKVFDRAMFGEESESPVSAVIH